MYPYHSDSVLLHVLRFQHIFAFTICFAAMYEGNKVVMTDPSSGPQTYIENIEKHKISQMFIVPIIVDYLATNPLVDQHDMSSVKEIHSGGSLLPSAIHDKTLKKLVKVGNKMLHHLKIILLGSELRLSVKSTELLNLELPFSFHRLVPSYQKAVVN